MWEWQEKSSTASAFGSQCSPYMIRSCAILYLSWICRAKARKYKRGLDLSIVQQLDSMSIAINGPDQSAWNFLTSCRGWRRLVVRVLWWTLYTYYITKRGKQLYFHTLTCDQKTGSNQIIECILWFLIDKARERILPKCLFFQLEKCRRENKNWYESLCFELLFRFSVFEVVEVSCLPVLHTRCDV